VKKAVHDFLEEKNEPPDVRALLCDNNWLFDLEFSVDVTDGLNNLNM